ncbi:MAG: type II secretion system F family protein [Candidatus Diapherotrites archaeon]|nr:type II secretion system F family protein [Candidatus Diapherotrites archaeon]
MAKKTKGKPLGKGHIGKKPVKRKPIKKAIVKKPGIPPSKKPKRHTKIPKAIKEKPKVPVRHNRIAKTGIQEKKPEKNVEIGHHVAGFFRDIFILTGRIFPSSIRKKVYHMLVLSGDDTLPEEWLGAAMIMSFVYSILAVLVFLFLFKLELLFQAVVGLAVFLLTFSSYFVALQYALQKATKHQGYLFLRRRFFVRMFQSISKFYPWNFRENIRKLLLYSGDRKSTPEYWVGASSLVALLYALVAAILVYGFLPYPIYAPILTFFSTFVVGLVVRYMLLYYATEGRRKLVERILPDFLQLIAADIRAGVTPFAALRASARKEFGPLEYEVQYATAKSLGTGSFSDALEEISRTIHSRVFERVIKLFSTGIKSGGQLSALLENSAHDITETQELNKQLVSSTKMYSIFILFNIVVGSPLMLAISLQFVDMVSTFSSFSSGGESIEGLGIMGGGETLPPEFLFQSAIVIIVLTSLMASAFMGVINDGSVRNGLKYFIPLSVISLVMFSIFKVLVNQIIGSMI